MEFDFSKIRTGGSKIATDDFVWSFSKSELVSDKIQLKVLKSRQSVHDRIYDPHQSPNFSDDIKNHSISTPWQACKWPVSVHSNYSEVLSWLNDRTRGQWQYRLEKRHSGLKLGELNYFPGLNFETRHLVDFELREDALLFKLGYL